MKWYAKTYVTNKSVGYHYDAFCINDVYCSIYLLQKNHVMETLADQQVAKQSPPLHSGKYWQFLVHYKIQILYKLGPDFFEFWRQKFHTFLDFRAQKGGILPDHCVILTLL